MHALGGPRRARSAQSPAQALDRRQDLVRARIYPDVQPRPVVRGQHQRAVWLQHASHLSHCELGHVQPGQEPDSDHDREAAICKGQ